VWPGGIKIKRQEHYPNGEPVWFVDPDTGEKTPVMEELTIGDRFRESIKLDTAMELLEEYLEEGKRIVIFSQFAEVIVELLARCEQRGWRAVGYYGDTPHKVRDEVKLNFDRAVGEDAKWDIVIAHYGTGGVGVNFTACERMILTDEPWNPGIEDQAMKRIKRIGQTEKTQVDILRIANHIDTWLANLIEKKRAMINDFNRKNEIYAEIRNLLLMRPE
jgi:SNF2 family DNA or RNA helicase